MRRFLLLICVVCLFGISHAQEENIRRIATNLQNPRGVAVLPDGRLIVAETGTGYTSDFEIQNTGKLSVFDDLNGDGDYDDDGERTVIVDHLPGYNILYQFNPGRDEIVGIADVAVLDDGRIFYTLDDNFEVLSIVELTPDFAPVGDLFRSGSTLNALVFDPANDLFYVAESSTNAIRIVQLDGSFEFMVGFDVLAHGQQAVPSGIAIDPLTGDLLVTLFSGQLWDYYGEVLSFMPGDAKVVRIDTETRAVTDEIVGLTTAVDVAVDAQGNLYVVEMTTEWPAPTMSTDFDLYAEDSPPDVGGYMRYSGRVTMYPHDGSEARILAEDLDTPTNITLNGQQAIISVGQGTPGRSVWVDGELIEIVGELMAIQIPELD